MGCAASEDRQETAPSAPRHWIATRENAYVNAPAPCAPAKISQGGIDMTRLVQSYVHGASDKALIGETIGALLDRIADETPGGEALVARHQSIRWTYEQLRRRADDLAAGLVALGLKPGERIGIWSPNNSEWVLTQFATAKAGLILVNINPAYRSHEFEYAMNKVGCKALILSAGFRGNDYVASLRALAPELDGAAPGRLDAARLPELKIVIRLGSEKTAGALNFADVAAPASPARLAELAALGQTLQFDDPINIQFTSGTTGAPKGATLTHHNILNNGYFIGEAMRLTPADRLCIPVPYYHCFGMCWAIWRASRTAPA
jgi:fatty-acyl-CoA synthase